MTNNAIEHVDVTMVIPTYNERAHLGALLERLFAACRTDALSVRVIVVDDNSADGTGQLADDWALQGAVQVIHRPAKLGLGSAVLAGFALADTEVVGVMDADLSHPPELIPRLYEALCSSDLDMAVASRYAGGGGASSWSIGRWILSRLGCWLSRPLTPVRDAMSGFFLLRRDCAHPFDTPHRGFKIGLELLVRAHPRRVAEIGYRFVGRGAGESKMSVKEGVMFLRQLVRLYAYVLSAQKTARPELVEGRAAL
jgi:dolichol-phosphate mannosyltransferase